MRSVWMACLCAGLLVSSLHAAEPVKPEMVEEGVRAMQEDYMGFIRASGGPWNIDDPTYDTLFIEPAVNYERVRAITQKLGIPPERIFVNLVMPHGSMADGYNAVIDEQELRGTDLQLAHSIAHEYAHNLLKHRLTASIDAYREQLAYCPDCTDPNDIVATVEAGFANPNLTALRERRKRMELEADEWAARRVAQHYPVPSAERFFRPYIETETDTKDTEGDVHPSRNRRLAAMDAALVGVSCRDCAKN